MNKRYLSFVLVLILLSCTLFSPASYVYALESEQYGYIEICVNGNSKNYVALKNEESLYLRVEDISEITSYDLDIGDRIGYYKAGNFDSVTTVIVEFDGTTYAMGKEYKVNIIEEGENIFLPVNEMFYLLHSQWCMEDGHIAVQPLPYTIIDFLGSGNYETMWNNKVNQTDLLIDGESELAHNLRSSLAAVFNDFDPMMFILWWPGEGMTPALNKEYEEALLQLAVDDQDFLDSYGQAEINKILENSSIGGINDAVGDINNLLSVPKNLIDGANDIDELVEWMSEVSDSHKSTKFNVYNDFSNMTPETLSALSEQFRESSEKLNAISDALSIIDLISSVSEVSQRSQDWGKDFISQIGILTDFDNMGYNTIITDRVKNVASSLIKEYQDPIHATTDEAVLQTTAFFLNKVFDESLFGKYFSIFNTGLAIAKTDENVKDSIDAADLSYMVDCLIKTEQIAMNEMSRSYQKLLDTVIYGDLTEQDIERLRNCVMLSLRTNLRNHAFVYYLNEKLTDDLNWKNSTHAQDIRNQIINNYALLCEVMETESYDKLILLDDFDNMYSDEYGMVRQQVTIDVFHEGEIPSIDYNALVTDVYNYSDSYNDGYNDYKISYKIPKINIDSADVQKINSDIYNKLYHDIVEKELSNMSYGVSVINLEISYDWAINGDVLSLWTTCNDSWGGTHYIVYNVSISTGKVVNKNDLLSYVGFSEEQYITTAEQVLGSKFWSTWDRNNENFQNDDFISWFNEALEKTISQENVDQSFPYINDKGELCIIAKVYSLAGADYYWKNLNMIDFTLVPDYATPVESNTHTNNASGKGWREAYESTLLQHPESTPFTYGSKTVYFDTEYTLYDIDKNEIPELIVKEDTDKYYIYSFDETGVVSYDMNFWNYDKCLYEYQENGIIVYDGGMGSMRIEYVSLYSIENNELERVKTLISTEEHSFDELYSFLDDLTPIDDFHPITDHSYLFN